MKLLESIKNFGSSGIQGDVGTVSIPHMRGQTEVVRKWIFSGVVLVLLIFLLGLIFGDKIFWIVAITTPVVM